MIANHQNHLVGADWVVVWVSLTLGVCRFGFTGGAQLLHRLLQLTFRGAIQLKVEVGGEISSGVRNAADRLPFGDADADVSRYDGRIIAN